MIFTTKEDIAAPIETVFEAVSDFDNFERAALRRGAKVERVKSQSGQNTRLAWDIEVGYRGKGRKFLAELSEFNSPESYLVTSESSGLGGNILVDLVELSKNRTRLKIELEIKPKTLSARLLIQSVKLAKKSLNKKFKDRVAKFAMSIEDGQKG